MAAGPALRRLLATALLLFSAGCAGHKLDLEALSSPSDQIVWEAGEKAAAKKDWAGARQFFKRIVDAFPQSAHQADARLALADSYFDEGGTGNLVLAVSSYREFLTLYPSHPKSDYAQFRAAESHFMQKNSADRDQTATVQALDEYQRLLDVYPQSSYVEQARARIGECRQALARNEFDVGYFYQRTRQAWRAAIARYEGILADYPDFVRVDEVLYRLSQCLAAAGRYAEARPQIGRLQSEFPKSQFIEAARKLEATFPPAGTPAASPAPAVKPPALPPQAPPKNPSDAKPPGPP
jgi:outer membrane protein assembly factor BamD